MNALEAAVEYADRGWRVFPVYPPSGERCSCGGPECKPGKHPKLRNWPSLATTDKAKIGEWWSAAPKDNIAIAAGHESNLVVLDVDVRSGTDGRSTLLELLKGKNPETFAVRTGSGGIHFYFAHPGFRISNSAGSIGPGLDIRGDRGCVIAPPSLHATGRRYEVIQNLPKIADLPDVILEVLRSRKDASRIAIGQRNSRLTSEAGRLRNTGMGSAAMLENLSRMNSEQLQEPLSTGEVRSIAESISRYPIHQRKNLPWMPLYMNEWFSSKAYRFGRDRECGWMINLIAHLFSEGGFLPDDREQLRIIAKATPKAFQKSCDVVLGEFVSLEIDGRRVLAHPHYTRICEKQMAKYQQKCEASALGVAARSKRNEE